MAKKSLLLCAVLVGCASAASPESAPPPDDPTVLKVEASDSTRAELGVDHWTLAAPSDGAKAIRGIDAQGATVFEFDETRQAIDATHTGFAYALRGENGSGAISVVIDAAKIHDPATAGLERVQSSFSDVGRHAVAALAADLAAAPPSDAPSKQTGLSTSSLHALDVPGGPSSVSDTCVQLVKASGNCQSEFTADTAAGAKFAERCPSGTCDIENAHCSFDCMRAWIVKDQKAQALEQCESSHCIGNSSPRRN